MRPGRSVATAALFICALFAACGGGDDDEGTPFPTLTPFPSPLAERLHAIRDRAARLRGLAPFDRVIEGTITRETLAAYYDASFEELDEEERADIDASEVVLRLLGLIDADDDLRSIFTEEFSGVIAGQYVPAEDRLVLVSVADGDIGISDEITLAHEYVHSFQDGAYDLDAFRERWAKSDLERDGYTQYSETLACLIEGDASLADELYAEQVFGPDWREQAAAEEPPDSGGGEIDIPPFLLRSFAFRYNECPAFVRSLYDEGGWAAVNAAFENPPDTTEQVLHPDKYRSRELANTGPPVDLTEDLDGWKRLDSAQFGEYDVFNYAVTLTGSPEAAVIAAAGWGSGWVRSYRDNENSARAVVQLSLGWDTRQDLFEFVSVFDAILAARGAQVEPVSEGNIRWTAEGQLGVAFLDLTLNRVEIRIATDADALELATTELAAFN